MIGKEFGHDKGNKIYDVELIPPLQTKNAHTPDVVIDGRSWEMKAPTGNGKNTMRNIMHEASRQVT